MTAMRIGVRMGAILGMMAAAGVAHGQLQNPRAGSPTTLPSVSDGGAGDKGMKVPDEIRERMEKGRNDDRQKRLVSDTDKLLALATSLKSDVDKTDKNTLSIDVIRRTEEIEKLAKSIRDRMKQ